MANNKTTQYTGGVGFGGALFILFLTLKLTGVIGWSWWWVTAPLWGGVVVVLALLIGFLVLAAIIRGLK